MKDLKQMFQNLSTQLLGNKNGIQIEEPGNKGEPSKHNGKAPLNHDRRTTRSMSQSKGKVTFAQGTLSKEDSDNEPKKTPKAKRGRKKLNKSSSDVVDKNRNREIRKIKVLNLKNLNTRSPLIFPQKTRKPQALQQKQILHQKRKGVKRKNPANICRESLRIKEKIKVKD